MGLGGQLPVQSSLQTLGEPTRVAALGLGQGLEPLRDLREALLACGLGHPGVHLGVLVGLPLDGRLEVLPGVAEGHVGGGVPDLLQEVHVAEGVAGLRLGGVAEEPADLGVPLDVGGAGEVQVAAVRLALRGESVLQVLVRLGALEVRHGRTVSYK